MTTRKRVVCSVHRRDITCLPPKGGIEYPYLYFKFACLSNIINALEVKSAVPKGIAFFASLKIFKKNF